MHRDPGVERDVDFRKNLNEPGVLARQADLTDADACAGADHGKLGEIAVGADFKGNFLNIGYVRIERAHPLDGRPNERRLAVETDHPVMVQIFHALRGAGSCQIVARRMKSQTEIADITHDDRILLRPVPHATPGEVPARTHEKLILVTFGTVFGGQDLLATAVAGLGRLDAQVVVAAPGRWLPQAEVIRQADVVVHHGGSGTMLAALASGVPQVVLPQGADQFGNALALVEAGAAVRPDAVSAEAIAESARLLLADGRYREAAGQVAEEIRHMPSPKEVADSLADVV